MVQFGVIFGLRITESKRNSHGSGDADRGRTAHDHGVDRVRDLFVSSAGDVGLFRGQLRLVDEAHTGVGPF